MNAEQELAKYRRRFDSPRGSHGRRKTDVRGRGVDWVAVGMATLLIIAGAVLILSDVANI